MALFSWFIKRTQINSAKNSQASLAQELSRFNTNTMWPIAKVRRNIVVQQQEFVNSTSHVKKETKLNTLKENTH